MNTAAWSRKIMHVDMDAFFAAVEQEDRPEYRGKPVVVGGSPESRGVVSTASYEARRYGIHSAMPSAQAKRLCPNAIFLRPRFQRYEEISRTVMAILKQHTDLVEPASLDEAYLDVTRHKLGIEDPVMIASTIKQTIRAVTRLTASAGVAPNKFLAKIASDIKKPDGLTVVRPGEEIVFLEPLPVRKIPGVGPVTEKDLAKLGVWTCGDLQRVGEAKLREVFGKSGYALYRCSLGLDESPVDPFWEPKQYSVEETFEKDTRDRDWMEALLEKFAHQVMEGVEADTKTGRTVVLKVKYHDFEQITRSKTLPKPVQGWEELYQIACRLLRTKTRAGEKPVRLLGLGLSGLKKEEGSRSREPDLFSGETQAPRERLV
ncbi:MAG: DNA polymerase IV [Candidatus Omnitrophota bacterium]